METSIPVVPYMGNYGNNDGFGGNGIVGGLVLGSLLGRGGFGGGFGGPWNGFGGPGFGGPAAAAVATDITLTPAFQSLQNQISNLSNTVNTNSLNDEISEVEDSVQDIGRDILGSIANLSTAQAAGNFTTLQSINGLGSMVTAQSNQNALQQLNSFNQLTTTTLTGFNNSAMQTATATNQLIAGQNALSSQLATCCCEIKEAIHADGSLTRALITDNRMHDLEDQLAEARLQNSQAQQTAALVAALGGNGNGNGNSVR